MPRVIPIGDRIARFSRPAENGCIEWIGTRDRSGYGKIGIAGRVLRAHRVAYEHLVGPIPDGLTIDHLCRNTSCVNVAHLEPVTQRENTLRGSSFIVEKVAQTHCVNGHEFTPENTSIDRGRRRCKACHAERSRERRARLKAVSHVG